MKVFKFGGASVKDANAVENARKIVSLYPQDKIVVVVSAMGKTTNQLEEVAYALWNKDEKTFYVNLEQIQNFHLSIVDQLFGDLKQEIVNVLDDQFTFLKQHFEKLELKNFDFVYDQIVSCGEVLSTLIVERYFRLKGCESSWLDCRKIILTTPNFREGKVLWNETQNLVQSTLLPLFQKHAVVVTQGFIGNTSDGDTTTLGREGSDYTAAILAFCINAESVTIWKDVDGMLNADPRLFADTIKLDKISYKEAIELAYYGASVIHPKTVKPLQNKNIPLFVKSFIHPEKDGTIIQEDTAFDAFVPSFIIKKDQVLMSFLPIDFSFIDEENFVDIFQKLTDLGVKVNLMQNTALSFSIVFDRAKSDPVSIAHALKENYEVKYNDALTLATIRHYNAETIAKITGLKEVFVEQRTRQTVRIVMK